MGTITNLDTIIESTLNALGTFGPILACILIMIESLLPFLPLCVFITLNFLAFGNILGYIISLIFTIIGCIISYAIFSKKIGTWFNKKIKNKETLNKLVVRFKKIHFTSLTVIIAMPFTPAFLINIAAGLVKMNKKKFISSLIIGKAIMVYFWGYIGTSLIKSISDPIILLRIFALLAVAYILSKLINKKLKLD